MLVTRMHLDSGANKCHSVKSSLQYFNFLVPESQEVASVEGQEEDLPLKQWHGIFAAKTVHVSVACGPCLEQIWRHPPGGSLLNGAVVVALRGGH